MSLIGLKKQRGLESAPAKCFKRKEVSMSIKLICITNKLEVTKQLSILKNVNSSQNWQGT